MFCGEGGKKAGRFGDGKVQADGGRSEGVMDQMIENMVEVTSSTFLLDNF